MEQFGNYKIKVNNEAESKEAQWLFCMLGGSEDSCDRFGIVCLVDGRIYTDRVEFFESYDDCKEITLPQLRDLVILHRNDVNDSNSVDPEFKETKLYLCSDKTLYVFDDLISRWRVSSKSGVDLVLNRLVMKGDQSLHNAISSKSEEQILISGADALKVLSDGKDVEVHEETYKKDVWFDLKNTKYTPSEILDEKVEGKSWKLTFRHKPETIKIELEIPAPFEPKDGEKYWIVTDEYKLGYTSSYSSSGILGKWRTEDQVKQVVTALRNAINKT